MRFRYVLVLVLTMISWAGAQSGNWGVGPHLTVSLPQSGFDNLSKDGEGIGGKFFYRFNNPFVSLRADLAYISYGERRNSEFVSYGYALITRRNESFQLTLGPQVTLRQGMVTAYAAALGGLYNYHTVVTLDSYYSYYPYSETTNSQTKWGWNLGGGLLFDLGIGPHLDLGFKYQRILNAETELEEKTIKQDATDYCITLGVVFFLR